MLDGGRCDFESFGDQSDGERRGPVSEELLVVLRAIEKEISQFIREEAEIDAPSIVAGNVPQADD